MMPIIESERLIINGGKLEDYVRVNEYDFNRLQDINGVFEYVKLDPNVVRSWFEPFEEHMIEIEKKNHYSFIIYRKTDNEPVGMMGFDRNDEKLKSIETSVYVHPNYWGNGYMEEAMNAVMKYFFDNELFENIIYSYVDENKKSEKLCKKLGFQLFEIDTECNNYDGSVSILYANSMSKDMFYELYNKNINEKKYLM